MSKLYLRYPHIEEQLDKIAADIFETISTEKHQVYHEVRDEITRAKEPYLSEILNALNTNTPLEQMYTAHDILNVLESLSEKCSPIQVTR